MTDNKQIHCERRSLSITGTSALTLVGTTNTHVVAFTGTPLLKWGTQYGVATSHTDPTIQARGAFVSIVNDAVFGTTFKFWRRGVYQFNVFAPMGIDTDAGASMALDLDSAATSLLAANNVGPTTANRFGELGVIDMDEQDGISDATLALKLAGVVCITDAMAGGAAPLAAAGAQGTGVVRLLVNDGAGGVAESLQNARLTLWCNYIGDLAG